MMMCFIPFRVPKSNKNPKQTSKVDNAPNEKSIEELKSRIIKNEKRKLRRLATYTKCPACSTPYPNDIQYCKGCMSNHFSRDFAKWNSGSKELDLLILSTQIKATLSDGVLEWCPWKQFTKFEKIGEHGKAIKALRQPGSIARYNYDTRSFWRHLSDEVVLKRIEGDLETVANEIIKWHTSCKDAIIQLYGFTKDPVTKHYMLVMEFAGFENLRTYIHQRYSWLRWCDVFDILVEVASLVQKVHQAGLIHKNIHPGNILILGKDKLRISDFGILKDEEAFGMLAYMAPEILRDKKYSEASVVYAFGMMMWELSSGIPPFAEQQHDISLSSDICRGKRPDIIPATPDPYAQLMQQCWHHDPAKRPNTEALLEQLRLLREKVSGFGKLDSFKKVKSQDNNIAQSRD